MSGKKFMFIKTILKKILPETLRISLRFYVELFVRRIKYHNYLKKTYKHYQSVKRNLDITKNVIRIGSYVVFDSTFGAYQLFELLKNKNCYNQKIVIIPDVSRGYNHMVEQYNRTKNFFIKKYGTDYVLDGWDEKNNTFYDFSDYFDIIYLANPYDEMVNPVHGIKYLSTKNVLPIYITYCFQPNSYVLKHVMPLLEISLFWKVFTDTKYTLLDYKKFELVKGKNVILTGYGKMDSLYNFHSKKEDKINIIISPHHTITNNALPFSNFLKYKDLILTLPQKFPNIHFIFRPHPLLFSNMVNEGFWTNDQLKLYIKKLSDLGIEYSCGGDYFEIFARSDAMINDCSSYIVEYLYTKKPCCFVIKDSKQKNLFTKLGKKCIDCWNLAYDWQDIEKFIQSVVDGTVDIKKSNREKVLPKVMINYPNASNKIIETIEMELQK